MINLRSILAATAFAAAVSTSAAAAPLPFFPFDLPLYQPQYEPPQATITAPVEEEQEVAVEQPSKFKRQIVSYVTHEAPGTIVVDTPNTFLYYVLGNGRALRYGIGVGREGFTWAGTKTVEKKAEWPNWHPPKEMIERQPYLPRFMAGGPNNPLGARAMYLSGSVYRIHGTNAPSTIGQRVSSGCIRLTNEDVTDLYQRVTVGAKVVVMPMAGPRVSNRGGFSTN